MVVIERLYRAYRNSNGISIDSRTVAQGELFFALSGENFDGNVFAQSALEQGASCAVVSNPAIKGKNIILVEDCLESLQNLAAYHRDKLNIPIIAITGSNGKTTTKELMNVVLSKRFNTSATKGNLNNHIGVPLSLLSIGKEAEIAIIEMGANHIGEIKLLCSIARPTHGLVTNIGKAHLEGFGSLGGVKIAKSELYDSLKISDGVVFVNLSVDFLEDLSDPVKRKILYVLKDDPETRTCDYEFSYYDSDKGIGVIWNNQSGKNLTFESSLYGNYNAANIATAATVGLHFDVKPQHIANAIQAYIPTNNRSQTVLKKGKTILLDAYNANPESMEYAIHDIAGREGNKSLILGGMNELGNFEHTEHHRLLQLVKTHEWGEVLLIGEHFRDLHQEYNFRWFADIAACRHYLEHNKLPDGIVLLKGSRSLQLDLLLDSI